MGLGTGTKAVRREQPPDGGMTDDRIDNSEDIARLLKGQKHYKVMIPSTETERGDVAVQVCGYCYQIKRDVSCEVPEAVLDVLRNAKYTLYTQRKREDGDGMELVPVISQRYAFQVG